MLRTVLRSGVKHKPLPSLARNYDPYRAPSSFDKPLRPKTAASSHRLADSLERTLQARSPARAGFGALKQTLEICETSGASNVTLSQYAQLLANLQYQLEKTPVKELGKFNTRQLELLENYLDGMEGLDARHYVRLIQIAHRTGRHDKVRELWDQVLVSDCENTAELWNAYLRARTDSVPRLRNDTSSPDTQDQKFWAANEQLDKQASAQDFVDPLEFIEKMVAAGVQPTRTTYTLALAHYARRGNLQLAVDICENIWHVDFASGKLKGKRVPHTSAFHPSRATLTAIIDAFGVNDRLVEGKAYCDTFAEVYGLRLETPQASPYWTMLMRHALYTAIPYGQTPQDMCNSVWNKVVEFEFPPTVNQYSLRIRDLLLRERLADVSTIMHYALTVDHPDGRMARVIETYLRPLLKRYTATGDFPKAIEVARGFLEHPRLNGFAAFQLNKLETEYLGLTGGSIRTTTEDSQDELDQLQHSLIQELRYIPEDDEDEEHFLQL